MTLAPNYSEDYYIDEEGRKISSNAKITDNYSPTRKDLNSSNFDQDYYIDENGNKIWGKAKIYEEGGSRNSHSCKNYFSRL